MTEKINQEEKIEIKIKRVTDDFNDIPLPKYSTEQSAGMDIHATLSEPFIIEAGKIGLVSTNIAIALPKGYECQVRSRSGLAAKNGVFCLNSPGTIDSDYRGEVKVILANFGTSDFIINNGDRIAQLVIAKHEVCNLVEVNELDETERGAGGFGSTGVAK